MQCPRCQHENRPQAKFCEECAAPLARVCSNCGTPLSPTAKFCPECAHPVTTGAVEPRFASPQSYTPKHLAEKILTSKAALEGERKQVTVLFADMKGSMELLADRDPEEARKLLDPVLERMMEAVHRYEGTVNQVLGDGIMALFGAPLAHEDHAVRACYAALDMQAAIRRHAEEIRRNHGVVIQVRVGLNSGEVVVRAIGSDLRMDYTAVGQTTHLAARMEQLAKPDTTLLTTDVLRLAEGFIAVTPLGPVPVKGLEAAIEVYEMTGAGPRRSRLHATAARGLTRFVGREGELEQLRQGLGRAAGSHGQVVAIVGEPGVGKSRLIWEVTHSHRVHGWLVLQAGSVSYGKATAYLPVVDLLRSYFAIEDRDGPRAVREKLTGKLLTLDRAQEGSLPPLLSLLDVPTDDPQWPTLDPPQRRRRTLDAVKRLLLRESQLQPLLVVFEDLHWIDSETQALLDGLVESLPATRLLLLVNYRPEYQHPWGSRTYYTQLRLDPLPPESAEQLLGALLGPDAALDPFKRALIARTEGNPFFLEESVRALVETGALLGERGAYRLARPLPTIQVPATVQAVLAARIDRLPPGDKALLQTASVIGKDVPFVLLQAIAEHAEDEVDAVIGRLQAAEFLYETRLFPELEYTFKHALTHEVAYQSLLQERRRSLHAQIATVVEQLSPEHVDWLAHHAVRGELWDKAVTYLRRAGAKAAARSAYREAVACFEQALDAIGHLPRNADTMALAIDIRLDLRTALTPLGRYREILDLLGEAEALAHELHDDRRLGHVVADMSARLRNTGDHPGALEAGRRALAVAARLGDRDLRFEATYRLAQAHFAVGDFVRSIDLLRQVVEAFGGERMPPNSRIPAYFAAWPWAWLALGLSSVGQFAEAIQYGDGAVRIAESTDHPHSVIEAQASLGLVHLTRGDLERAIALFERGLAPSRAGNIMDSSVFSGLGYAYALAGRVQDGLSLLQEAVDTGRSMDSMGVGHAMRLARLGEGYLLAGRLDEALERAQAALELARMQKERANEASALRLVGAIAVRRDPLQIEIAAAHYGRSLTLAEELGMRPLIAHCHLGLSRLYGRMGRRQKAQEHLTTATTMYRDMDMRFWLEQAEAQEKGLA